MADPAVVSLADRLKQRREELGISQSQAARELDVARTAYRLWEMEAAKPAPDRWRLISRWLGVSVTTMLLAEDLLSPEEATYGEVAAVDFARSGRDGDAVGAAEVGNFFEQARALLEEGAAGGHISEDQAAALTFVFARIEAERPSTDTAGWEASELRKSFAANDSAPRAAREAFSVVADDLSEDVFEAGRLLVSELVTNSIVDAPAAPEGVVGLYVAVDASRLRVEVSDGSPVGAQLRPPSNSGGYGLTLVEALSSRWGTERENDLNVTWFELDLPSPGDPPVQSP
jgi:transcriptional regulator with XRE-family HTH domain/anti-sigma regulatory factor (Ser/Thr protein kinase)